MDEARDLLQEFRDAMLFRRAFRVSNPARTMWTASIVMTLVLLMCLLTTAGANDGKTSTITGQVLQDKSGETAPGARVILLPPPPRGQDVYIGLLPLREVTADAEGRFAFESLPPGKYRVWANKEKQTSRKEARQGMVVVIDENGNRPKPIELRLIDGVTLSVRVKDKATGKPIPNATVHLGWSDLPGDFRGTGEAPIEVQPLTAERWLVETWADGYAKGSTWINLQNGKDAEVEFSLGAGGDLLGVARDAQQHPVSGVGLSISEEGHPQQREYTTTDAEGRYRLEHLPRDTVLVVRVSKLDYLSQQLSVRLTERRQTRDLVIEPRPHGGSIEGIVADEAGRPIAGAVLVNTGMSSREIREATSGKDGTFRLENLYAGSTGTEVTVQAKKFAPQRLKVEPGPADRPSNLIIRLEAGHRILGRVEDDRGRPIEGVTVYFAGGNQAFSNGGRGVTDKEGRFDFDSLPADCPFTFQKAGFSQIDGKVLPLDGDDLVTVEMIPSGVIAGKVIDRESGKPILAFTVRITFSPQRAPNEPAAGLRSDLVNPGQAFRSGDGAFRLTDLVAQMPLQVMIDAEGYERCVNQRVVAARSDGVEDVEFELERVDPATLRSYRGSFVDAKGTPVVGAQLRLIIARDRKPEQRTRFPFNWQMIRTGQLAQQAQVVRFLEATTDNEGRFAFTNVPRDAEAELAWWGSEISSGRVDHLETLAEENGPVEISLPRPARVTGKIDRETYAEIGQLWLRSDNDALEGRQLDLKAEQSEYEIGNLPPGTYSLVLMGRPVRIPGKEGAMTSSRLASTRIDLEDGESKRVDFTKDLAAPADPRPPRAAPAK